MYISVVRTKLWVENYKTFGMGNRNILCTLSCAQRYTYRVLQTIQVKLILLCVLAEPAILGSTKTALRFKYES